MSTAVSTAQMHNRVQEFVSTAAQDVHRRQVGGGGLGENLPDL